MHTFLKGVPKNTQQSAFLFCFVLYNIWDLSEQIVRVHFTCQISTIREMKKIAREWLSNLNRGCSRLAILLAGQPVVQLARQPVVQLAGQPVVRDRHLSLPVP